MQKLPLIIMAVPGALTDKESDFCNAAGIVGIVLSLFVLGQHMYIMPPEDILVLIPYSLFIYCAVAFSLLLRRSTAAPVCLIIAAALLLIYMMILTVLYFYYGLLIFSYILIGLFIFTIVILVVLYIDKLPAKLRDYQLMKRSEDNFWEGKV